MNWEQLMAMFAGSQGGAMGAQGADGLAGALDMSALQNAGAQQSMGNMAAMGGGQGLMQTPPVLPQMGAQGLQIQQKLADPTLPERLASSPIDPARLMQMIAAQEAGQPRPPMPSSSPAGGRSVGQMQAMNAAPAMERASLAQLLGGR